MRHPATLFILVVLSGSGACSCADSDVIANVGEAKLRASDLELHRRHASARRRPADASAALATLVDRELLAEAAREAKLPEQEEIAAALRAAEREVLAKAYLERALDEALREDALRKRYEEQRASLTKRTVHVRHLVVRAPRNAADDPSGDMAAQARAMKLYARARSGEDFAELAREASDDEVSARRGGDLGEIEEAQINARFFEAAAKLKAGELSEPLRTPFGFHLIQAVSDPGERTPSFDEVRGTLAAEARREAEDTLMRALKDRISVRVRADLSVEEKR